MGALRDQGWTNRACSEQSEISVSSYMQYTYQTLRVDVRITRMLYRCLLYVPVRCSNNNSSRSITYTYVFTKALPPHQCRRVLTGVCCSSTLRPNGSRVLELYRGLLHLWLRTETRKSILHPERYSSSTAVYAYRSGVVSSDLVGYFPAFFMQAIVDFY